MAHLQHQECCGAALKPLDWITRICQGTQSGEDLPKADWRKNQPRAARAQRAENQRKNSGKPLKGKKHEDLT